MPSGAGAKRSRSALDRLAGSKRSNSVVSIERQVAAGEVVVTQGDTAADMFIIQSGRVEVRHQVGEREFVLGVMGPGEFFGEMSVLESLPRSATVVALEDSVLLELGAGALLLRIRRDPTLAVEMLQKLSSRIRSLHAQLDALHDPDDANHVATLNEL